MQEHDFFRFMSDLKKSLAADYQRIRNRSSEDPGTAGDQAEEDWAQVLRNWLPAIYPVVTKGRILFEDRSASPQVDVLVLKPSYPLGLRREKYIFSGGVIAAFECKLTLRREDIDDAFRAASTIKKKARNPDATPYDELNAMPYYGLIAHSQSLQKGRPSSKLHQAVEKCQTRYAKHPRELLDVICVADTATLPLSKHVLMGKDLDSYELEELRELEASALVSTMYVIHDEDNSARRDTGAILAGLIHELTYRMGFQDPTVRDWADHLSSIGTYGGIGRPVYWTPDALSAGVRGTLDAQGRHASRWSKWCKHLP